MYRISKRFEFSASHRLDLGEGHPCSRMHGHNYTVEIVLASEDLDEHGMVLDYGEFAPFKELVGRLDHQHLNDLLMFEPTVENLAGWLFAEAQDWWGEKVVAVRVSETGKTWGEYARQ